MAMTISGSNGVTYPDGTSQASGSQACKAWVNFNGTGTVAIRASYNVTSITDNGTGDYTVNFTTALADANYSSVASCGRNGTGSGGYLTSVSDGAAQTSSQLRIYSFNTAGVLLDTPIVNVSIFR